MTLAGAVGEKGDVSDLLDAGGIASLSGCLNAAAAVAARQAVPENPTIFRACLAASGLSMGCCRTGRRLLFGESGVGKSFVAIDTSVRIAGGESVFRPTASGWCFTFRSKARRGLHIASAPRATKSVSSTENRLPLVVGTRRLDLLNADSVSEVIAAVAERRERIAGPRRRS